MKDGEREGSRRKEREREKQRQKEKDKKRGIENCYNKYFSLFIDRLSLHRQIVSLLCDKTI